MKKQNKSGDSISASISGPVSGQVAVGKDITQTQQIGAAAGFTKAEEAEFRNLFANLKEQIAAEAPPDKKAPPLEQVEELHQALSGEAGSHDTYKNGEGEELVCEESSDHRWDGNKRVYSSACRKTRRSGR